ncbi:unnamed protein product [Pedinophyceae sp. YPF-701]|nr:unnamed protein product [Pedinophyceae sp. YPF-701]
MGDEEKRDARFAHVAKRIETVLKVSETAVEKMFKTDEYREIVERFLNDNETTRMLVSGDKDVAPSLSAPGRIKKKLMYFVKRSADAITPENVATALLDGEIGEAPLEQLLGMSQEVFLPLLTNTRNQQGWPDVITREVVENVHKFVAEVTITMGRTQGKTLLPLPPVDGEEAEALTSDKDLIHVLESEVVMWTRQIKNVLKLDPESVFASMPAGEHPGPLNEIDFWESRAADLNSIHEQVTGAKVAKVVRVLELAKSTYYTAFSRLLREVDVAREEANHVLRYLKPIKKYFEKVAMMDDFPVLVDFFRPMMHLVLLVWKRSKYYNTPNRLVILIREVCNDLIAQSCRYVDASKVLSEEPQESVAQLNKVTKVLGTFKDVYQEYRQRSLEECPENPWRIQSSAMFMRLDAFLERVHDLLELAETSMLFLRLDRVEIGGTRGRTLTATVKQIFGEFMTALEKLQQVEYDLMDVECKQFDDDFFAFRSVVKELERRLGSVLTQAFDDCATVESAFKLLDGFEGLLERDIIKADLDKKNDDLMWQYFEDIKTVHHMFHAEQGNPPIAKNSAPCSGAVAWARGLRRRLQEPMERVQALSGWDPEMLREVVGMYESLQKAVQEYEGKKVREWYDEVARTSDDKLKLPLLKRDAENETFITVNFDPALVRLLREVKYFKILEVDIPESAQKVYEKHETFRRQVGNFDLISGIHNNIQRTLMDIERPLVQDKLDKIGTALQKALTTLNWNSHKIDDYISEVMSMVRELQNILNTIKGNVAKTSEILARWEADVMFVRKEGKVYTVQEFHEAFQSTVGARHDLIAAGGEEVAKLLSLSNRTLKVSKGAPAWKSYVEHVGTIVVDGTSRAILASLEAMLKHIDPDSIRENDLGPLLEVQLELRAPDIVWVPEIASKGAAVYDDDEDRGLRDHLHSWVKAFLEVGTLMKRLDTGEGSYEQELEEDYYIADVLAKVSEVTLANEAKCAEFHDSYKRFEYLWTRDLQETLQEFLRENATRDEETGEVVGDPPLAKFDEEITRYKMVQDEIAALPTTVDIGMLRIDCRPIKQALGTWVTKWVFLFTHYLQRHVTEKIDELDGFIGNASHVLEISLDGSGNVAGPAGGDGEEGEGGEGEKAEEKPEGETGDEVHDPEAEAKQKDADEKASKAKGTLLYKVMATLRDIRKRKERTEAGFGPMNECVELLQTHGIQLGEAVLAKLENLPSQWRNLMKKLDGKKEEVALAQQIEGQKIRGTSDRFGKEVEEFRSFFQRTAPFTVPDGKLKVADIERAYRVLDQFNAGAVDGRSNVMAMIKRAQELRESQDLFDLFVVDYVPLTRCKEELQYLKEMWDMVGMVLYTFEDWNNTKWDIIDTEMLSERTKAIAKEIRTLNKNCRAFDVYKLLDDSIKAMQVSLPLVADLHHPAMRERHWKQLMKATGKHFTMDENFSLGDLLALELHNYVEEVGDIVDRAQKELVIEKQLKKIDETWAALALVFEPYQDSEVYQVVVDDTIREALENDNMLLQNMAGGKYVQGNPKFVELVNTWQRKLGGVVSCLDVWLDVQKKWQNLESIFIGSADIRVQLPEDSKRFDGINADYQDLMRNANDITNCVEACNQEGRQERLDNMQRELEQCEKALQDYLETKRMAFPRFYFVAPADLLDILSKGSNPQAILKHLSKCFANVDNLEFHHDDKGAPTKTAIAMVSGEKERVSFAPESYAPACLCDGPVENWLQTVEDSMVKALSYEFKEKAMPGYEEKKRKDWIFDHSVQMTIVVSRVYFTQEVNEAFSELEDGNEDALKAEYQRQVDQISDLIDIINTPLTKNDRKRLITLCTIDVHARDVIQRLIDERVEAGSCFQWQSQLRYFRHEKTGEVQVNIVDADIRYSYEYIGNVGCLCITPLTDRCYITLTQAQRLVLGGAPAGPAGTGKTETVKDLARALGVMCYVFNCSDQMDYKVMGMIYKGLAQTGAWGCFDEFNRIPVAVLSVCSTQYKTVLDALRMKKERFTFEDVEIPLRDSIMAFITMNPGYPGRAELPESLKALFRPVSMVVPDLGLICEIMLMAEGFQMSKILSRKFIILYKLCEDLLSKSRHYDWKLRAIKTTLYVAGGMKRMAESEAEMTEDKVLLRALRDFNLGKLTSDDTSIFMGLLNDLFPKTVEKVPRAIDYEFEAQIKKAAKELALQGDERFCLKISQLREIFVVRWSVFLLGPAGCGKSAIWKTLKRAQNNFGEKTDSKPINPKSVTRNELYGFLHPQTREWKEGLISTTFRNMATDGERVYKHQWIVLDGDIDAEWIESMNTVMDDNKMLTLASNERIPLKDSMRLLLEINHMVHCSPATVSRGGVIFVNQDDVGWKPAKDSWIEGLECDQYRGLLTTLFEKYVETSLEHCRRNFKTVVPLEPIQQVQTICKILEGILPSEKVPAPDDKKKKLLETNFVFACVWAFGGCMLVDKVYDFRTEFSRWWCSEFKTVAFPDGGLVFDFYVDQEEGTLCPWQDRVADFTYANDGNFGNIFVPTVETTRLTFFLDSLIENKHYVMFVGNSGTGKTAIMRDKLKAMDQEAMSFYTINMNSFLDAPALQVTMEQPLQKSNVRWGPPGNKRMVYFIDDMNMPFKDKYDTQSAIELVRQYVDYGGWYDKVKIVERKIASCQLVSCMNPTAGSFFITPRMQRHFSTFAVQMPPQEIVRSVYVAIAEGHMAPFEGDVAALAPRLVDAMTELHKSVMNTFLPSAVKFHYQWNLRDLSNITQGLTRMTREFYTNPVQVVRLFVHECERVFLDRMVNETDMTKFNELREKVTKKHFSDISAEEVEARPNVYTAFMQFDNEENGIYVGCPTYDKLKEVLEERLKEYNDANAVMDLVLFQQAMEHVARIARIINLPRGNAMLVGVGGSGRQSLARLASFLCGYEVFQITVTSTYGVENLKEDLISLYTKCGAKSQPITFLMTDNQIVDERFLVYMNDLLSSGIIADLFTQEDKDNFCNAVRNEAKQAGVIDTQENLWDFFIEKVRKFLHIVLCFSPAGDKFRVRARQFPALVTSTVFDWFHSWPHEALVSVAQRFLGDIPAIEDEVRENLAYHMAFAHQSVTTASTDFLTRSRRYNYVTPKSYLELIALYKKLLEEKRGQLRQARERLENGLDKIASAAAQVQDLQVMLQQEQIVVEEKKAKTEELIVSIGKEKAVVDDAVESSRADEEECAKIAEDVGQMQAECERDLSAAEPLVEKAIAALNSLDKGSLTELKSLKTPGPEIQAVAFAVQVLFAPPGKVPKDKDLTWQNAQKFMGDAGSFLNNLLNFDKENIPEANVERVEKNYKPSLVIEGTDEPDIEGISKKSKAAAGLASWVVNVSKYFRVYQFVEPKRQSLAEANRKLEAANKKLSGIRAKVKELQDKVAALEEQLMQATEEKNNAVAQAEKTQKKADLADRLINGLAGEKQRWGETVSRFQVQEGRLVGDVLLASAFVAYAGPFSMPFRVALVSEKWTPDLVERKVPMSDGITPMDVLATDTLKAKWSSEGLPTDPLSMENGAIMTNSARWSLMIDPQLQGIKWIVSREEPHGIKVIQLTQNKYIETVKQCIENGVPLMIENIGEDIDAVLDPVISRSTIKKGRNIVMKIGDDEVEYDDKFRLYLQTKLSSPHYKPEIAAQTTLVNFCVTEKGLEDQLLALVVSKERPDLQSQAAELVSQLNQYTVTLAELEDNLLFRLANSQGDILEDIELVENLEQTKATANDIAEKVDLAKKTQANISKAREVYRPVATRGSLVYFLIDNLDALDRVYHYSMANFVRIMRTGMDKTPEVEEQNEADRVRKRVAALIEHVTLTVFKYVAQGLFERHKLIVATQLCVSILKGRGELDAQRFDYLLRGPRVLGVDNPVHEWVADPCWAAVQALKQLDDYSSLPDDLVGSAKRWREWMELERAEEELPPGDWKRMSEFDRLLIFRALRPDRLTNAMRKFVHNTIGEAYVTSEGFDLERSLEDSAPHIPVFVFLSPGVDVAGAVEALGRTKGKTLEEGTYASISLGQGQEVIAMRALQKARKNGGWCLLQNVHLTIDWTAGALVKVCDKLEEEGTHDDFRLFISAEPPPALERGLPISLLQQSIKLTNEPPEGLKANLLRAHHCFSDEIVEASSKQAELRSILFALCYFHAVLLERKKFGVGNLPGATSGIGWNMNYPFNTGDLLCCGQVAVNFLEISSKVPWDDLRYVIGEIMYGGHIVEDWDRRLANAYLFRYFNDDLVEGTEMFPGFPTPPNTAPHKEVTAYIEDSMPAESPIGFGLHPNAEIGFKLREGETFCASLLNLQPRDASGDAGMSDEERAKQVLDDLMERLPDYFDMEDIRGRIDDFTPYIMVAIQEAERMNVLLAEMRRSLVELDLGLKGDLTMSEPMERLMRALSSNQVPGSWRNLAYPSLRPLASWMHNLLQRVEQLVGWTTEMSVPPSVWLSGLFNPQSFLTAVMQTTARRNDWPLDKTIVVTEVTKKQPDQVEGPPRDGAYVHGLTLEGARWDEKAGVLDESLPKQLFCAVPVIQIRAIQVDRADSSKDVYQCPVYATEARFREEIFTAQLKSKASWIQWTCRGVCMFLDVVA